MITHDVQIRVRYAETDQMGYVYYGNYASYLEVARVETIRQLGFSYKELEDLGTMMPVVDYTTKFIRPAKYDDLITIKTVIKEKPGVRIVFEYEIFNEENVLLNISKTTLVFVDKNTMKPAFPHKKFQDILNEYYK